MRAYKFLPADFAMKAVVEHRLKMSEFADMNDPFELAGLTASDPSVRETIQNLASITGALCFTEKWNNPLLWSHYADKHRGVCLGFDLGPSLRVETLNYVKNRAELEDNVLIDAARKLAGGDEEGAVRLARPLITKLYSTKFEEWRYELEIRVIAKREVKDGDFYFCDFCDDLKLREVIAGARCSVPRAILDHWVASYADPPRIFKVRLADSTFELVEDPNGVAP